MQLRFINQNVARAVHGLELVIGLLYFHWAEHTVLVKTCVAAGFPKVEPHDVRSVNEVVAALEKLVAQPVLDDFANQPALWMPENEAGAGLLLDAKKIEFDTKPAMVAALGLFQAM